MAETWRKAQRGAGIALVCALALTLLVSVASAPADRYTPPGKTIWHGVSDTGQVRHYKRFNRQVKAHTALLQEFFHWGVPLRSSGALHRWTATDTRGVVSLSTSPGSGAFAKTMRRRTPSLPPDPLPSLILNP